MNQMMALNMQQKRSCSGEIWHQVGIVCEILSWLPVKSLMRFKCVSKNWQHIIQNDKYFTDLFNNRSKLRPSLFVVVQLPLNLPDFGGATCIICREYQANLLTASLCERGRIAVANETPVIQNISNMVSVKYDRILKPVNGMICFTDTSAYFGVRIYNLGTRELTPWLEAAFEIKQGSRLDYRPCYQFGFDPATKEHKVICLLKSLNAYPKLKSHSSYVACKVLTVGNNAWRTIEDIPKYDLEDGAFSGYYADGGSVYVNGCVYWITDQLQYNHRGGEQKVIVAFDVGSEKFSSFEIPKFITDQLLWSDKLPVNLLEVNDRLGILRKLRVGDTVKMWILDDEHTDQKVISTTASTCGKQSWIEVNIELPFQWDEETRIEFHGVPGIDEILIETSKERRNLRCLSLFYFNWKSMTFTKVESDKLCSSIPHLNSDTENASEENYASLVSTFAESLSPVNKKSA